MAGGFQTRGGAATGAALGSQVSLEVFLHARKSRSYKHQLFDMVLRGATVLEELQHGILCMFPRLEAQGLGVPVACGNLQASRLQNHVWEGRC